MKLLSTMFLWRIHREHECWFSSNNEKVTGTKILSGIIFYWVSLSREIFTGTLCILERRLIKSKTYSFCFERQIYYTCIFFSLELNNGCRIPKEKIEQHYISPFLCIYLSLLATNYFAFMHHFIFFKVNFYKKNLPLKKYQITKNSTKFYWLYQKGIGIYDIYCCYR